MALAKASDDAGDPVTAVRLCKLVGGEARLDALLLATRIQHRIADFDGEADSLNSAKLLAHHQAEVAKVAETEALMGNLDRAERLMARLRRESDQARVLAAMVNFEAQAKDFANAEEHLLLIDNEYYKSLATGTVALAHAELGRMKESAKLLNAIEDSDVRRNFQRGLTARELQAHGVEAGRAVAVACHDGSDKAVCLSLVATWAAKSGDAVGAPKIMAEAQASLFPERDLPPDAAIAMVCGNLAASDMADDAMKLAEKSRDSDVRVDAIQNIVRLNTRLHDARSSRKLIERLTESRERAAGLVGMAEGLLDEGDGERNPS
jgi:hypothetical protein